MTTSTSTLVLVSNNNNTKSKSKRPQQKQQQNSAIMSAQAVDEECRDDSETAMANDESLLFHHHRYCCNGSLTATTEELTTVMEDSFTLWENNLGPPPPQEEEPSKRGASAAAMESNLQADFCERTAHEMKELLEWHQQKHKDSNFTDYDSQNRLFPHNSLVFESPANNNIVDVFMSQENVEEILQSAAAACSPPLKQQRCDNKAIKDASFDFLNHQSTAITALAADDDDDQHSCCSLNNPDYLLTLQLGQLMNNDTSVRSSANGTRGPPLLESSLKSCSSSTATLTTSSADLLLPSKTDQRDADIDDDEFRVEEEEKEKDNDCSLILSPPSSSSSVQQDSTMHAIARQQHMQVDEICCTTMDRIAQCSDSLTQLQQRLRKVDDAQSTVTTTTSFELKVLDRLQVWAFLKMLRLQDRLLLLVLNHSPITLVACWLLWITTTRHYSSDDSVRHYYVWRLAAAVANAFLGATIIVVVAVSLMLVLLQYHHHYGHTTTNTTSFQDTVCSSGSPWLSSPESINEQRLLGGASERYGGLLPNYRL